MSSLFAFGMPGGPEWIIIFVVMLLLFGAKKLPELARGIGRSLGEFKKAKEEFEQEINYGEEENRREEARRREERRRREFEESKKLSERSVAKADAADTPVEAAKSESAKAAKTGDD